MAAEAFHHVVGDIVDIIETNSEVCREAVLTQLLVTSGNLIGRGPHRYQGGTHYVNLFAVLAGSSGISRKGTS